MSAIGPKTYGPYTPTAGVALPLGLIDPQAVAIQVKNRTKLDMLVFFGDNPPSTTSSLNGEWQAVVPHGHTELVPIQTRGASLAEKQLNTIGAYRGQLTIMPSDNSGNLAQNGTKSSTGQVWITAYGPFDIPPQAAASPLTIDLASQPRVIDVPIAIPNAIGSLTGIVNGNKQFISAAFVLSADCLANLVVFAYFHSWRIRQRDTASAASYSYQLEACIRNSGGTILQTTIFHFSSTDAGTTTAPSSSGIDDYFPARPTWFHIGLNALVSPFDLIVQFHCTGAGGTPNTSDYALQFSVDTTNGTAIGDIGNWPPAPLGGATNPLLY